MRGTARALDAGTSVDDEDVTTLVGRGLFDSADELRGPASGD
ncbi:hypothetical protein PI124_g22324 [Phytophthora idaei]|nr:hypothetical protein PI125_g2991 [Phytophthora idaei]KAG3126609.1 hypothetical protein PI126_g22246 [Phytophthora idaei]KAG3232593.1 hypothetical protein PI124_g22324 [Phytophthora idaei]